jgi:mannose-6-phosphate isomerase
LKPEVLGPNQFRRFYRGGPAIAALRGLESTDEYAPEDWVGSTATTFGARTEGLTRLPDGTLLREALRADPEAWLGPAHVARFGADPALLVKLLDAGERLPVHFHPGRSFAARYLDSPYGKTEAWYIVSAPSGARVGLGFAEEVSFATVRGWVDRQDVDAMLGALNWLEVAPGDAVFVPAGTVHAIEEGLLICELQEPTDFSVLLEWDGFDIDGAEVGHLGLGFEVALQALDRAALDAAELERLRSRPPEGMAPGALIQGLLPGDAHGFFGAQRIRPGDGGVVLEASLSILVVLEGGGQLTDARGVELELRRGMTVLVPFSAGECIIGGGVDVLVCRPPDVALS